MGLSEDNMAADLVCSIVRHKNVFSNCAAEVAKSYPPNKIDRFIETK
jgi:hypothetical protein